MNRSSVRIVQHIKLGFQMRLPFTKALLAIFTAAAVGLVPAASASAAKTAAMLGFYNADRSANGLPPVNVVGQSLEQGCANHDRYMWLNKYFGHGEDPSKPGYTAQGASPDGAGEVLAASASWSASFDPWWSAPLHLFTLFDPTEGEAGYANAYGYQCMRVNWDPSIPPGTFFPPAFYAWTSDYGAQYVPPNERALEDPFTPQQMVGIPAAQATGPNILLFSAANRATPESATLTDSQGSTVPTVLINYNTQNKVDSEHCCLGGGVLIPLHPLRPLASYTVTVQWSDPAVMSTAPGGVLVQQFTFRTTHRDSFSLKARSDHRRHTRFLVSGTPKADLVLTNRRGHTLTVAVKRRHSRWLTLPRGVWRACASSASPSYPGQGCVQVVGG